MIKGINSVFCAGSCVLGLQVVQSDVVGGAGCRCEGFPRSGLKGGGIGRVQERGMLDYIVLNFRFLIED